MTNTNDHPAINERQDTRAMTVTVHDSTDGLISFNFAGFILSDDDNDWSLLNDLKVHLKKGGGGNGVSFNEIMIGIADLLMSVDENHAFIGELEVALNTVARVRESLIKPK